MKRIIISDTHLGSSFYRSSELLEFLSSESMDQLILAGDIIDFIKVPTFTLNCGKILEAIKSKPEIIYVVGNHDDSLVKWVGTDFFGIEFVQQLNFHDSGRSFRVEHGDKFTTGPLHVAAFVKILSVIQHMLEAWFNIDLTSWWIRRQLRKHKLRSVSAILNVNNDIDVFIMGHTHIPEAVIWVHPDQTIKTYVNAGDWVTHQTYVEIEDGRVRLREFKPKRMLTDETDTG